MRPELWSFRLTRIDLEELDVTVELWHATSLVTVTVAFRLDQSALKGTAEDLRTRIEQITGTILTGLAASLAKPNEFSLAG
jgi:hypothetical protein